MWKFFLKELVKAISILLFAILIVFLLMHLIPGTPWRSDSAPPRMLVGASLDSTTQKNLDARFGLDLPLWRQFTRYIIGDTYGENRQFICGAICGNLGPSITQRGRSVQDILFAPPENMSFWKSRFGYSILLVLAGAFIAIGLGVPFGIISATTKKAAVRRSISVALAAMISIPSFILGLLAIIVLASWLKWIPVLPDWNKPSNWIVPAVILAMMPMANIARVTRATLINVVNEDYIRTARAKGLPESRVIGTHVLRNVMVPILTYLGPALLEMIVGLIVVETLYSFPGIGREFFGAVLGLDYPMILGLTLIYATGIVLINLLNEMLSEILDPRIRMVKQQGDAAR